MNCYVVIYIVNICILVIVFSFGVLQTDETSTNIDNIKRAIIILKYMFVVIITQMQL